MDRTYKTGNAKPNPTKKARKGARTTIKPAELAQVDKLFDDEDDEVLSSPNTAPKHTGVRS